MAIFVRGQAYGNTVKQLTPQGWIEPDFALPVPTQQWCFVAVSMDAAAGTRRAYVIPLSNGAVTDAAGFAATLSWDTTYRLEDVSYVARPIGGSDTVRLADAFVVPRTMNDVEIADLYNTARTFSSLSQVLQTTTVETNTEGGFTTTVQQADGTSQQTVRDATDAVITTTTVEANADGGFTTTVQRNDGTSLETVRNATDEVLTTTTVETNTEGGFTTTVQQADGDSVQTVRDATDTVLRTTTVETDSGTTTTTVQRNDGTSEQTVSGASTFGNLTELRGGPLAHDGRAARHVTTDDVELPVQLPEDRNVTFAVVIWRGDTNGNARFFSSADATTMAMFIRGQVYGNTIKQLTPQGWIAPDSPGSLPVPTQQWCFVAVSMDATAGTRRAYVIPLSNGAVTDAGGFAATLGWDTSYRMGDELLYAARPVGGSAFFWLSDAFVVPRTPDDTDILGLYDAARTSASFGSGVQETTRVELNDEGGFTTTVQQADGTSLETVRDATDTVLKTTTVEANDEGGFTTTVQRVDGTSLATVRNATDEVLTTTTVETNTEGGFTTTVQQADGDSLETVRDASDTVLRTTTVETDSGTTTTTIQRNDGTSEQTVSGASTFGNLTELRGGPLEHDGRAARHVTTDDVELPVELPEDRNVTFAVVIWRGDTNGNARFFSSADATTMAMFIRGQVYGNTIKQLTPQGWIAPDSPGSLPVPTQQWCFVAVSMDATAGTRRAYVIPLSNGAVTEAGGFAATLGWDTSYRMGDELLYAARPVGGSAFFWLSDAFVVPRTLDDTEVLDLYDAARTSASLGSGVQETTRVELNQEGGFTTTIQQADGTSLETVRDATDAVLKTTTVQTNTEGGFTTTVQQADGTSLETVRDASDAVLTTTTVQTNTEGGFTTTVQQADGTSLETVRDASDAVLTTTTVQTNTEGGFTTTVQQADGTSLETVRDASDAVLTTTTVQTNTEGGFTTTVQQADGTSQQTVRDASDAVLTTTTVQTNTEGGFTTTVQQADGTSLETVRDASDAVLTTTTVQTNTEGGFTTTVQQADGTSLETVRDATDAVLTTTTVQTNTEGGFTTTVQQADGTSLETVRDATDAVLTTTTVQTNTEGGFTTTVQRNDGTSEQTVSGASTFGNLTELRGGPLEHDGRAARHVTTGDVELPVELPEDRNVTFAVVIWRGDTNGNARFFSSADATTMAMFIRGQVYGNTIKQLTPQGWIAPDSPGSLPVPTQQWCFVAVSMDATAGTRRAYVIPLSNGAVTDAGGFAATLGWDTSYRMGDELLYAARPVGGSAFFWLSDAFVVPRTLDDTDILDLYNAARTSASLGSGVTETTRVELNDEGGFTTTVEKADGTSVQTVRDATDAVLTTTTVQTNTEGGFTTTVQQADGTSVETVRDATDAVLTTTTVDLNSDGVLTTTVEQADGTSEQTVSGSGVGNHTELRGGPLEHDGRAARHVTTEDVELPVELPDDRNVTFAVVIWRGDTNGNARFFSSADATTMAMFIRGQVYGNTIKQLTPQGWIDPDSPGSLPVPTQQWCFVAVSMDATAGTRRAYVIPLSNGAVADAGAFAASLGWDTSYRMGDELLYAARPVGGSAFFWLSDAFVVPRTLDDAEILDLYDAARTSASFGTSGVLETTRVELNQEGGFTTTVEKADGTSLETVRDASDAVVTTTTVQTNTEGGFTTTVQQADGTSLETVRDASDAVVTTTTVQTNTEGGFTTTVQQADGTSLETVRDASDEVLTTTTVESNTQGDSPPPSNRPMVRPNRRW